MVPWKKVIIIDFNNMSKDARDYLIRKGRAAYDTFISWFPECGGGPVDDWILDNYSIEDIENADLILISICW